MKRIILMLVVVAVGSACGSPSSPETTPAGSAPRGKIPPGVGAPTSTAK